MEAGDPHFPPAVRGDDHHPRRHDDDFGSPRGRFACDTQVRPRGVAWSSSGFVRYSTSAACPRRPFHVSNIKLCSILIVKLCSIMATNVNYMIHCRRTSGVTTGWLRQHFGVCPLDAEQVQVERHARARLWYLLACFLLPDSSGDTVDSALLPILDRPWVDIATFSWASCTLAHMYRQLCDGCQRKENSSSIGGCLYLL